MSNIQMPADAKQGSIHAVVIRADGTTEDLGVLTCSHKRLIDRLKCRLGRIQH